MVHAPQDIPARTARRGASGRLRLRPRLARGADAVTPAALRRVDCLVRGLQEIVDALHLRRARADAEARGHLPAEAGRLDLVLLERLADALRADRGLLGVRVRAHDEELL